MHILICFKKFMIMSKIRRKVSEASVVDVNFDVILRVRLLKSGKKIGEVIETDREGRAHQNECQRRCPRLIRSFTSVESFDFTREMRATQLQTALRVGARNPFVSHREVPTFT